jgi:hypothetical protein
MRYNYQIFTSYFQAYYPQVRLGIKESRPSNQRLTTLTTPGIWMAAAFTRISILRLVRRDTGPSFPPFCNLESSHSIEVRNTWRQKLSWICNWLTCHGPLIKGDANVARKAWFNNLKAGTCGQMIKMALLQQVLEVFQAFQLPECRHSTAARDIVNNWSN